MAFEMTQGNDNIRIHDGVADFCSLHIRSTNHGNFNIIGSLQAVRNHNVAAHRQRIESVGIGAVHVLQCIFTAAHIQRVAIRQERLSAVFLDEVHNHLCIVGAEICHVARLTEVNFNCRKLIFKINFAHTGGGNQTVQLFQQVIPEMNPKICIINF